MVMIIIHFAEVNRLNFQKENRTRSNRRDEAGSYMRLCRWKRFRDHETGSSLKADGDLQSANCEAGIVM